MNAQSIFLSDYNFNTKAEGESLILPLLLAILTFSVFLMSSNSGNDFSPTLNDKKTASTASSSKADSKKSIVDVMWSCSFQSMLDEGRNCGTLNKRSR